MTLEQFVIGYFALSVSLRLMFFALRDQVNAIYWRNDAKFYKWWQEIIIIFILPILLIVALVLMAMKKL